jgi:hypothetical protein
MESERVCSRCGTINRADAKYCETCAAPLDAATESGAQFVEDDLALRHVDPNNRVELDRFELASGLALFQGVTLGRGREKTVKDPREPSLHLY